MTQSPVSQVRAHASDRHCESTLTVTYVRVGMHGHIGRFVAVGGATYSRSDRVVCRTSRGIEVGDVLNFGACRTLNETDGKILRLMRPEDELLWGHMRSLSQIAFDSCVQWLESQAVRQQLLDVEPLFDGRTLYFHFMCDVEPQLEKYVDQLARLYERQLLESEFAQSLEEGCGPNCGTELAENGCGSGCAVCRVGSICRNKT